MSKIDQYWRVFATGLCFTTFGLGGLVLSFLILPSIALTTSNTIQKELKTQRLIRFSFHAFCRIMKFTGAIDYRIDGAELLREDRNCIIVANHPSLIDYVLIASGTSERQMKTAAQSVEDLGKERGTPHFKSTRDSGTTWVVVDFVETVVHLFEPDHRVYYDLESLWSEGRQVDWA